VHPSSAKDESILLGIIQKTPCHLAGSFFLYCYIKINRFIKSFTFYEPVKSFSYVLIFVCEEISFLVCIGVNKTIVVVVSFSHFVEVLDKDEITENKTEN